ncbi:MAG: M48 family metalloprotease, partial [Caulobacteraceae bacterium]
TRGLMENLSKDELEAVLAHEMSHVINRDVRLMVIAAIFAGIITLVAQIMLRALQFGGGGRSRSSGKGGGGGAIILVALVIAAIGYALAIVIKMAISRKREFIADMGAVELTKNPDAMISALLKISGNSQLEAPDSVQSMFLDHHEEGVMGLFATHPPIDKRIEALVKFGGGHMPEPVEAPAAAPAVPATGPWAASETASDTPSAPPRARQRGPWS